MKYVRAYTFALTLTLAALNAAAITEWSSECVKTEKIFDHREVYMPKYCRPKDCDMSGNLEGVHCEIRNYEHYHPDACKEIEHSLLSRQQGSSHHLDEVCQPLLTSISLYKFVCQIEQSKAEAVSLNFTFQAPICNNRSAVEAEAVKVDFSASSMDSYFAKKVCRVFNFSGSEFSSRTSFTQKTYVSYDCIGIGLQDDYPAILYYLAFTSFPSEAHLNYTIVFMDVKSDSMQLLAGAWRSRQRAHITFLPIAGIQDYILEAKSRSWTFTQEISVSTVEITDIPFASNTVTVTIRPNESELCARLGYRCSPITLTLHDKNNLNLPLDNIPEDLGPPSQDWILPVVVVIGVLITAVLIGAFIIIRRWIRSDIYQESVLWIADPSFQTNAVEICLKKNHFKVIRADLQNGHHMTLLRDHNIILFVIHSSITQCNGWEVILRMLQCVLENRPLWDRVRVISLAAKDHRFCTPSDILLNSFNNRRHRLEFYKHLDEKTFYMPQDKRKLIQELELAKRSMRNCQQSQREESICSSLTSVIVMRSQDLGEEQISDESDKAVQTENNVLLENLEPDKSSKLQSKHALVQSAALGHNEVKKNVDINCSFSERNNGPYVYIYQTPENGKEENLTIPVEETQTIPDLHETFVKEPWPGDCQDEKEMEKDLSIMDSLSSSYSKGVNFSLNDSISDLSNFNSADEDQDLAEEVGQPVDMHSSRFGNLNKQDNKCERFIDSDSNLLSSDSEEASVGSFPEEWSVLYPARIVEVEQDAIHQLLSPQGRKKQRESISNPQRCQNMELQNGLSSFPDGLKSRMPRLSVGQEMLFDVSSEYKNTSYNPAGFHLQNGIGPSPVYMEMQSDDLKQDFIPKGPLQTLDDLRQGFVPKGPPEKLDKKHGYIANDSLLINYGRRCVVDMLPSPGESCLIGRGLHSGPSDSLDYQGEMDEQERRIFIFPDSWQGLPASPQNPANNYPAEEAEPLHFAVRGPPVADVALEAGSANSGVQDDRLAFQAALPRPCRRMSPVEDPWPQDTNNDSGAYSFD